MTFPKPPTKPGKFHLTHRGVTIRLYAKMNRRKLIFELRYWFQGKEVTVSKSSWAAIEVEARVAITRLQNGESESVILSGADLYDYRDALDVAKSLGQRLPEALRQYFEAKELAGGRHLAPIVERYSKIYPAEFKETLLADAVEDWVTWKESGNNVKCTGIVYRGCVRKFARTLGGNLQDIDIGKINAYVREQSQNAGTRKRIMNTIADLINWCVRTKRISDVQVDLRQRDRYKGRNPGREIFSPQDLAAIIAECDATLILMVALVTFGAVRAAEAGRLQWKDINWQKRLIYISEVVSKTGQERWIPICDTLMNFLAPWQGSQGPICLVCEKNAMLQVAKLSRRLGKRYVKDILRHCYASYRIGLVNGNVFTVSEEMGNSPEVLKRHYLNRVADPGDVPLYWAIAPCPHNGTRSKSWTERRWRVWMKQRTAKLWIELEERGNTLPKSDPEARARKINELTEAAAALIAAAPFITPNYP